MSMYAITYSPQAEEDLQKLKKSEPRAFHKAITLLMELVEHPKTGTGHPEPLKGEPQGRWSRRITSKLRLIYRIYEKEVYVDILSAYGHYDDK